MTFGKKLKDLRARAGLSQSGLAETAGVPIKTIQAWEINRRTPRWIGLLARLARGLGVTMDELAAWAADEEERPPPKKSRGRPRKGK
jgi:transcriptional regulator with XRE-family HTH domain